MTCIVKRLTALVCLLITILSNFTECGYCPASVPTVSVVSECPKNKTEWEEAANRKKCSYMSSKCGDKTPVYHCLLNQWRNETVEVCASTWYISGFCAVYNTDEMKVIDDFGTDCTKFSKGKCPTRYISTEAYLYQTCYMQNSSKKIPFQDIRNEETNDCILSIISAIIVSVLVLVIVVLLVFFTLRLKISKKAPDEECMHLCNATKQNVEKSGAERPLIMEKENEDNTMNQTKETAKFVSFGDAAESKRDIQQKKVHTEKDGIDNTRPGEVNNLKAEFDPVGDKERAVKKDIQQEKDGVDNTRPGDVNDLKAIFEEPKSPGPNLSERAIKKPNTKATDDIQKAVLNTSHDGDCTLLGNCTNEEGNDEDPAAHKENDVQKEVEQKMDYTVTNDSPSLESLINEEKNNEVTNDSSSLESLINEEKNNEVTNDSSSLESLINEEKNNEESDAETEKPLQNEEFEKKAGDTGDGGVSQAGAVKRKTKLFEFEKKAGDTGDGGVSQAGAVKRKTKLFEEKSGTVGGFQTQKAHTTRSGPNT